MCVLLLLLFSYLAAVVTINVSRNDSMKHYFWGENTHKNKKEGGKSSSPLVCALSRPGRARRRKKKTIPPSQAQAGKGLARSPRGF